jgi:hypothetical protein
MHHSVTTGLSKNTFTGQRVAWGKLMLVYKAYIETF